jgi:hypothetical protein
MTGTGCTVQKGLTVVGLRVGIAMIVRNRATTIVRLGHFATRQTLGQDATGNQ